MLSARAEVGRSRCCRRSGANGALRASGGGPTGGKPPRPGRVCSPRERRWADRGLHGGPCDRVLSARAEVGRALLRRPPALRSALRASGGGPKAGTPTPAAPTCSPRERRWAADVTASRRHDVVLSARAEVGRQKAFRERKKAGALRASGGGPGWLFLLDDEHQCSPRERRWAASLIRVGNSSMVLSARAEVGRSWLSPTARTPGALRASGGGPWAGGISDTLALCSPRERRWAVLAVGAVMVIAVLSARAEVGRSTRTRSTARSCALRASGGGPGREGGGRCGHGCSPRERRWAASLGVRLLTDLVLSARARWAADQGTRHRPGHVLSARAEVGRRPPRASSRSWSALRASGGGPARSAVSGAASACSPRERRWAAPDDSHGAPASVLSARAEVGRAPARRAARSGGALRASGGGSAVSPAERAPAECSPRERRWVAVGGEGLLGDGVLSARAEVGRTGAAGRRRRRGALRASGGGSIRKRLTPDQAQCSLRQRRWVDGGRGLVQQRAVLSARAEVGRCATRSRRPGRGALRASGGGSCRWSPFPA